ncbi:MAG: OsmC family protein [Planctomycetota bacterium]|jgi:uncharacterized OsmC-like protein
MADIQTTYEATQHCRAVKASRDKSLAIDCPYSGPGREFSPTNLVEAALGSCMLLAMGTYATRHGIDLSGARIDVEISATEEPVMRYQAVDVVVMLPPHVSEADQAKLEKAADACPVKHSFAFDIPVTVRYLRSETLSESKS